MYVHVCMYLFLHIYIFISILSYENATVNTQWNLYVCTCMYVYTYLYMYIYKHIFIRKCDCKFSLVANERREGRGQRNHHSGSNTFFGFSFYQFVLVRVPFPDIHEMVVKDICNTGTLYQ